MKKRPGVGVGVIVLNSKKEVLLGKRKSSNGEGTWCFPGGHLEYGEGIIDCARRETLEETGMKIKINDETVQAVTNDFFRQKERHYITLYVKAEAYANQEPRVVEPNKAYEWRWFEWNNLPSKLFLPIKNLLNQRYNPLK